MKIGSVSNMSSMPGLNMDVANRSIESNNVPMPQPVRTVDIHSQDFKVKSQDRIGNEQERDNNAEEVFDKSIDQANKSLAVHNRVIERAVHEVTHAVMYTIKDTVTDEVIAEFPPKKIQDMIAKMWELAGLFVDEKA